MLMHYYTFGYHQQIDGLVEKFNSTLAFFLDW